MGQGQEQNRSLLTYDNSSLKNDIVVHSFYKPLYYLSFFHLLRIPQLFYHKYWQQQQTLPVPVQLEALLSKKMTQ